ncbi:hypothetical protein HMSSN139_11300 [Paenibacillus sp. HMSSN-139]|nr:hypothetical protein HMSSN139_11300 [Paenibacillus sp. HMSSN-139]
MGRQAPASDGRRHAIHRHPVADQSALNKIEIKPNMAAFKGGFFGFADRFAACPRALSESGIMVKWRYAV